MRLLISFVTVVQHQIDMVTEAYFFDIAAQFLIRN